jgi:hypothetical protein
MMIFLDRIAVTPFRWVKGPNTETGGTVCATLRSAIEFVTAPSDMTASDALTRGYSQFLNSAMF